jgi:uroporphyrinogen-III synthase
VSIEQIQSKTEIEWLHRIGSHIAVGDALDETLATTVSFAGALVKCDSCLIYVQNGAELVPWNGTGSDANGVEQTKFPWGQECRAFLTRHRVPIAISSYNSARSNFLLFDQWSIDPGEAFVAVPLLARQELVGVVNLLHDQPRRYNLREVKLLSAVGHLLGAGIGISRLESQNSDLLQQLETRKLVERGKGILQRDLGLSEEQAYLALQRQSRQRRKSMKEIAQAVILGDEVKRNSLSDAAMA